MGIAVTPRAYRTNHAERRGARRCRACRLSESSVHKKPGGRTEFWAEQINAAKRSGWLDEPYPGVLTFTGAEPTWQQRLRVATFASGSDAIASHRAAARLHRLDGFAESNEIEISVGRGSRWRHGPPVIAHHVVRLERCDEFVIDGIPCTGLARTLADLGSVVSRTDVRRALIDARRRHVSLRWLHTTVERLHRPGQRGTGVLMRELSSIPTEGRVTESWFEELIAEIVSDPSLPDIERQYELRRDDGTFVARIEVAIPSVRLGLEAHSRRFHFGPDAEALDEQRDLAAATCGWELVYLGWYATKRPAEVVSILRQIVAARRRDHGTV